MLPDFLFPEAEVRKDGEGPPLSVENAIGRSVQITLGILEAVEQEFLDVQIYGSPTGDEWIAKPLAAFGQKFYKGTYTLVLDLAATPDVQFLRVKFKANRWGHWGTGPVFKFFVFAQLSG